MKCILSSHSSLCKLQIADEKKIIQKYLQHRVSLWCPGKQERQRKVHVCVRVCGGVLLTRISPFAFPLNLISLSSHAVLVSFTVCSPLSCLGMLRSSKVYPSWFTYSEWPHPATGLQVPIHVSLIFSS